MVGWQEGRLAHVITDSLPKQVEVYQHFPISMCG